MSDKQQTNPVPETQPEQQKQITKGYIIGTSDDGEFIFQAIGTLSVVEILGYHQIATEKIAAIRQASLHMGWPLLAEQIDGIAGMVKLVIRTIAERLTSKPD